MKIEFSDQMVFIPIIKEGANVTTVNNSAILIKETTNIGPIICLTLPHVEWEISFMGELDNHHFMSWNVATTNQHELGVFRLQWILRVICLEFGYLEYNIADVLIS